MVVCLYKTPHYFPGMDSCSDCLICMIYHRRMSNIRKQQHKKTAIGRHIWRDRNCKKYTKKTYFTINDAHTMIFQNNHWFLFCSMYESSTNNKICLFSTMLLYLTIFPHDEWYCRISKTFKFSQFI